MLFADDLRQLVLVPVLHPLILLLSVVGVEVLLGRLPLHGRVVRELAFVALLAEALLEEGAEDGLGIDTCEKVVILFSSTK